MKTYIQYISEKIEEKIDLNNCFIRFDFTLRPKFMFYVYGKTVFAYFNKKTRRLNIYTPWKDKFNYNDLNLDLTVVDWFHALSWFNEYIMDKKI